MRNSSLRSLLIKALLILAVICTGCEGSGQSRREKEPEPLPDTIPGLVELLGREHDPNRNAAIDALVELGEESVPALLEALEDEDAQDGATHALARIGLPAVPSLVEALGSEEYWVRYGAITALGEIGADAGEAVPLLVSRLGRSRYDSERIAILHALGQISPSSPEVIDSLRITIRIEELTSETLKVIAEVGPEAESLIQAILPVLTEAERWPTRHLAIEALEAIGPVEGIPLAISQRLQDDESAVRARAAEALGNLGTRAAWTSGRIADLLDDEEGIVQRAAAQALGQLAPDSRQALGALIDALSHEDPQTRREVAFALGKFGPEGSGALSALRSVAESDQFDYVRSAAEQAIAAIEETESTE